MKISCLVIDDEPLARRRLRSLIENVPELELLDNCKTGQEAITKIQDLKPNLIFLDIQMKDMSGFDVLKNLKMETKPVVVFVTAFDQYAVKAFEFLAFDYLLKPFKRDRFDKTILRVFEHFKNEINTTVDSKIKDLLEYIDNNSKNTQSIVSTKLPVKVGNTVSFLNISEIKYIVASGSYIDIHTDQKTYVLRTSLGKLLSDINTEDLVRIHRSTIINVTHIKNLIHSSYGEVDVKMMDSKLFRVSKSYKKEVQIKLGI